MGVLDTLTSRNPDLAVVDEVAQTLDNAAVAEQLDEALNNLELIAESLADVELSLDDRGWRLITLKAEREFTRTGLLHAAELARVMAIVNPLIRRALSLRTAYVWADGVQIAARATGMSEDNDAEQDVNAVVQDFLDDKATLKVLTSASARETNERTLGTDGMFALALFTKPLTGRIRPVEVPTDEITEIISNPDDSTEVWFYKRVRSTTGGLVTTLHPDIDFRPRGARPIEVGGERVDGKRVGGAEVIWDAPIILLKVNGMSTWDFGIGDAFAALPWARGYKEYLEDWAKVMRSLSRFVWRQSSTSKGKAATVAGQIRSAATQGDGVIGAAAIGGPGTGALEAIPKSGATIDAESGKPLAAMVAAAMDVPVTMLLADPGQTGARAVAETLDRPTENMARMRRAVWGDFHRQLLGYVIDSAVRAPRGALKGTVAWDEWDREVITLAGDTERTIVIDWPDLEELDVKTLVDAIVAADGTGKMPPVETLRQLLMALKVRDIDEIIEAVTDEDGNWIDPELTAGDVAVRRFRQGEDPADGDPDPEPDAEGDA